MSQHAITDFKEHDRILLADFTNETGDSRLGLGLLAAFTVSVEQSRRAEVYPRSRVASVLRRMGKPPDTAISSFHRAGDLSARRYSRAGGRRHHTGGQALHAPGRAHRPAKQSCRAQL